MLRLLIGECNCLGLGLQQTYSIGAIAANGIVSSEG